MISGTGDGARPSNARRLGHCRRNREVARRDHSDTGLGGRAVDVDEVLADMPEVPITTDTSVEGGLGVRAEAASPDVLVDQDVHTVERIGQADREPRHRPGRHPRPCRGPARPPSGSRHCVGPGRRRPTASAVGDQVQPVAPATRTLIVTIRTLSRPARPDDRRAGSRAARQIMRSVIGFSSRRSSATIMAWRMSGRRSRAVSTSSCAPSPSSTRVKNDPGGGGENHVCDVGVGRADGPQPVDVRLLDQGRVGRDLGGELVHGAVLRGCGPHRWAAWRSGHRRLIGTDVSAGT